MYNTICWNLNLNFCFYDQNVNFIICLVTMATLYNSVDDDDFLNIRLKCPHLGFCQRKKK